MPQPQLSMQRPPSQSWPAAQVTPAQGLATQRPLRHDCPSGQRTPAQRSGGSHATWGAKPGGHIASQGRRGTQPLVVGSQKLFCGHTTPRHGTSKQPGTHAPSMQVCPVGQATPAQGSVMRTQRARQTVLGGHTVAPAAQGFAAQWPPTQRCPAGHDASVVHAAGSLSTEGGRSTEGGASGAVG